MNDLIDVRICESIIETMTVEEKVRAWADVHHVCQLLETSIKHEVLNACRSVVTDVATARFYAGRTEYDYEGIARELGLTGEELAPFTSLVVDYRSACLERGIPRGVLIRHSRIGAPYVVLKHGGGGNG